MVWIEGVPGRLVCPGFADGFLRCEAVWGLQAAGEVVGGDETGEMLPELIVAIVMEAHDRPTIEKPL